MYYELIVITFRNKFDYITSPMVLRVYNAVQIFVLSVAYLLLSQFYSNRPYHLAACFDVIEYIEIFLDLDSHSDGMDYVGKTALPSYNSWISRFCEFLIVSVTHSMGLCMNHA